MDIKIRGNYAWVAESSHIARKVDLQVRLIFNVFVCRGLYLIARWSLETRRTVQVYKGHTGPVTSLVFCSKVSGSGDENILITGSWDKVRSRPAFIVEDSLSDTSAKTIKIWDTEVSNYFILSCGLATTSHWFLQDQGRDLINSSALGFRQDTPRRALSSAARVW